MSWPPHDPLIISQFAQAIAREHGWQIERCEPWRAGASNAIWALDTDKVRAVLKIGKLDYWRRLGIETSVLECLGGSDAPRLLAQGMATEAFPWDWAVLERVDGTHPYTLDVNDAREIGRAIARMREKTKNIPLDEGAWKVFAEERIYKPLEIASKGAPEAVMERFTLLRKKLSGCDEIGKLLDSLPPGITHGDLIPYNLIRKDSGGFCFIDWELTRRASAAWDLSSVRKAFILADGAFAALREGLGEEIPDRAIDFANAIHQLEVASWRAEMWFGRGKKHDGDFFLIELGQELGRAEMLLNSLL